MEVNVTPRSKLTSVRTAEHIAMVLSALINSGGGVLVIHLVTNNGDINLDTWQKDIIRLITEQEIWIPENVFRDTISITSNEAEKEIYFFTNTTTHVITHNSNAYYIKQSNPETIVNSDVLTDVIKPCTCLNDTICEKHEDVNQILSMVADTDTLTANQVFPVLASDSETHFCRNYQLNNHSLPDVLNTQSVSSDIRELVSALANTKGGSIFLGVTNTTTPTVVGYRLGEDDMKCTEDRISDILIGRNPGPVTIWGYPRIESKNYCKTFIHDVVRDDRKVIEIRVNKCPGGMFCALPICLDIRDTGEIHQIELFSEWKKRALHGISDSSLDEETDEYHKHFERQEMTDTSSDLNMPLTGTSGIIPKPPEQTTSSTQFCWWLSDDDGVVAESLQFDRCCSKELADSEMDISTTFSTFPDAEAIIERFANIEHIEDTLKEILQEHKGDNGVAVFLENVPDTVLPIYVTLKDVTPVHHVFDLVILKERRPPVIVAIFKDQCSREEAKTYCLKLGQLLKRNCSKYAGTDKSSTSFFFHCQLYFISHGYQKLQQEGYYPKHYLHPSTEALKSVRYALARTLLDCHHFTDRYGNIMVRHLSAYQARVLLQKRPKVLIVKAIAGSGKTVLALEIARRIKKQNGNTRKIVFLCRSRGLAAFVKSQTKRINVFESVIEYNSQPLTELGTLFSQYTDIIIDDAHAIPVSGEQQSWTMYNALFLSLQNRLGHAYIFLDPDMQDYRGCTPDDFVTKLEALARRYVGYKLQVEPLGKILRNSRRICQFTKACLGMGSCVDELTTIRQIPEDGVFFQNIEDRRETTTLLSRLSNLKEYNRQDITIPTENQEDKAWVREMLKGKYATQDSTKSTVKHVVVDTLENFKGLERHVMLFLIPQSWGSAYIESVKSVIPRAISRVEFLLPWDASQRKQDFAEFKTALSLAVSTLAECISMISAVA